MTATTSNEKLQAWVSEWAEIFQPDAIHWCDGTEAEYDALCQQMVDAGTFERIRCDIGTLANCVLVGANGAPGAAVPAGYDFTGYQLIPGVLHAYKASAEDLARYVMPGSKPGRK